MAVPAALTHEALLYSSDAEYVAALAPFVRDGLRAGEPTVAFTTPDRIALLRDALGREADGLAFVDGAEVYRRPARTIDGFRRTAEGVAPLRNGRIRVIGEVQFGATDAQQTDWTRYELLFNGAFRDWRAWVVCPYDTRALDAEIVEHARSTHPFVTSAGERRPSAAYVEPSALPRSPSSARTAHGAELARVTAREERHLDALRRVVASEARAAGFARGARDDLMLALAEPLATALSNERSGVTVRIVRAGSSWICELVDQPRPDDRELGLWPARALAERVDVVSTPAGRTLRLTLRAPTAEPRRRILDAAAELFARRGIGNTGVNTLIAHAGVAKATFYHHFPAKADLVVAWLERPETRWFERVAAEVDRRTSVPAERLVVYFDVLGEWFADDGFRGCPYVNTAIEITDETDPAWAVLHLYMLEIRDYFRRNASDAGLPDADELAGQLFLLVPGAIVTAVAHSWPGAAAVAAAAAARLVGRAPSP